MANKKFCMTLENFGEVAEQIDAELSKSKATKKESLNAQLLLEENFMRLVNIGKAEIVSVEIFKRFGDLNLKIESEGSEYNPLVSATDFDENDEDYFRTIILKANSPKMSYTRKGNKNLVFIQIHENNNKQLHRTLIGMVAGIFFGVILNFAAPSEFILFFNDTISDTVQAMFMNALTMMIAPVVFFSIITGITGLTNTADVGRIGGKLLGLYSITTFIATVFSLAFALFIFSSGVPQVGVIEGTASNAEISLLSTIKNIIPKNLVDPIIDGNLIQIIFISVIFGLCINKLGDKVKPLDIFIQSANTFCLTILTVITTFIPLVVFFSMSAMMATLGMDTLTLLGKLLAAIIISDLFMIFCVYSLILRIIGKLSPLPLLKKIVSFISIPFATSSSNVSMPFTMKFCTQKLGISPKLSAFSIPIGATINMDGTAIFYSMPCIMLLKMYGVEIDPNVMFILVVSIFTISIGTPGIPGGAMALMAAIVGVFGVPAEAVAIILGILPIADRTSTVSNVIGDIAITAVVAENEKMLDKDVYSKM